MTDQPDLTDDLTEKQKLFCEEYIKDFNGTESAKRAGYGLGDPGRYAIELLRKPHVKAYIEEIQKRLARSMNITQERVLMELAKIAFANLGEMLDDDGKLKPFKELTKDQTAALTELHIDETAAAGEAPARARRKIKLSDKQQALITLARHLGMFKDGMNLTADGFVININKNAT